MAPALPAGASPAPGPREEEGRILQKETGGPIKWQLGKLQGNATERTVLQEDG